MAYKRKRILKPDWSDLNADLLDFIMKKLPVVEKLQLRSICRSWRSIAKTHISYSYKISQLNQSPWVMLPNNQDYGFDQYDIDQHDSEHSNGRACFNIKEKKLRKMKNMQEELGQSRCVGSSHGWLVFLEENKKDYHYLFNPFLDVGISVRSLPVLSSTNYKVVLFLDPVLCSNNYGIVAIYGCYPSKLVYATCGDSDWTHLKGANPSYCDVISCKSFVYVLGDFGSVEAWDFSADVPSKMINIRPSFPPGGIAFEKFDKELYSSQFYLVESEGELFLVKRYIGDYVGPDGEVVREEDLLDPENEGFSFRYMTMFFLVYKLDLDTEKWLKVATLGDRLFFLGGNHSVSLQAKDFGENEKNLIYFTDDYWERMDMDPHHDYGGHDMGVFNLEDGSIKRFYGTNSFDIQPPPFWVVPRTK